MADTVHCLSAEFPEDRVDELFEYVDPDWNPTSHLDLETQKCRVSFFTEDAAELPALRASVQGVFALMGVNASLDAFEVAREDWAESWKRYFHVEKVSDRLVVRPSWESYEAQPGERVMVLDPGMCFGTGKHETTRCCLQYLDRLAAENADRVVLDMGCGTGILSIAARLLGFRHVLAFDIDPDCIPSTRENARRNGVELSVQVGDLSQAWPKCDVVVANILAPILIEFSATVTASVKPGGRLILSGILDSQYADVKHAYVARGARELDSLQIGEWRAGLFTV